ncbi:hypothetical protein RMI40_32200 [Pseudomonas protegens]|uniref:hypothetical protein n=1 Tax=Pseudomonas TaxID=286 RepID=UPI00137321F4|nr:MULTISPECIES: hypothetical protein [Pseudomonas]MDS9879496.1 hypothetical protein [Pseudomonas protegens]MDT9643113.1 hypothetical protein [Pseudomonas sp. JV245A]NAN50816.1 hypothetical protein [Pseudomonas protegens]NUE77409.1 hypothetical protein [Pseudomonas protegens]
MSTKYLMDASGSYIGAFGDGVELPPGIEVEVPPDYADQKWQFPGWGPSLALARQIENDWRNAEMAVAEVNVTAIQFGDPDALPGTESAWKAYWIALKNWAEGKGGYPDSARRPVRPA